MEFAKAMASPKMNASAKPFLPEIIRKLDLITRIASFTTRQENVVGMHFFNPAPFMKLIELIRAMQL
jgi:hypothetical protein